MFFRSTPDPYRPHRATWRQPLHLHLAPLWDDLADVLARCSGRVLDIGCGLQPYRPMLGPGVSEYVGLDREGALTNPTVVGDAYPLPFEDATFDVVLATQVFEHVPEPEQAVSEAARVLRAGGRLIFTVPGVWPTHEAPHDHWRYTRHGLLALLDRHGLELVEQREQGGLWATVGQMINLELQRHALLRQMVPIVNLVFRALDRLGARHDLVLNWMIVAQQRTPT
ncbi:MAG: class I SAM-dependent methyltransferase [Deltaproteobacteria bacterium]|nr:class I SAM-dependent methyltransferase [Deltaproteobacteria bacterium]